MVVKKYVSIVDRHGNKEKLIMEKWKTYPCKHCIVKSVCAEDCFMFPHIDELTEYAKENDIKHKCLGCGHDLYHTYPSYLNGCQTLCVNCRSDW